MSRTETSRHKTYGLPKAGLKKDVIAKRIAEWYGPDATVEEAQYDGKPIFRFQNVPQLTPPEIAILKDESTSFTTSSRAQDMDRDRLNRPRASEQANDSTLVGRSRESERPARNDSLTPTPNYTRDVREARSNPVASSEKNRGSKTDNTRSTANRDSVLRRESRPDGVRAARGSTSEGRGDSDSRHLTQTDQDRTPTSLRGGRAAPGRKSPFEALDEEPEEGEQPPPREARPVARPENPRRDSDSRTDIKGKGRALPIRNKSYDTTKSSVQTKSERFDDRHQDMERTSRDTRDRSATALPDEKPNTAGSRNERDTSERPVRTDSFKRKDSLANRPSVRGGGRPETAKPVCQDIERTRKDSVSSTTTARSNASNHGSRRPSNYDDDEDEDDLPEQWERRRGRTSRYSGKDDVTEIAKTSRGSHDQDFRDIDRGRKARSKDRAREKTKSAVKAQSPDPSGTYGEKSETQSERPGNLVERGRTTGEKSAGYREPGLYNARDVQPSAPQREPRLNADRTYRR